MSDDPNEVIPRNKRYSGAVTGDQLDLFQHFVANDPDRADMSNTLVLWDSFPTYHIPRELQRLHRDEHGRLPIFHRTLEYQGTPLTIQVQPAVFFDEETEKETAFYPGETEELIEEVLRKMLAQQNDFTARQLRSPTVSFSLWQIQEELRKRGKARSYKEIVQALEILGQTVLTIKQGKRAFCSDVILSVVGVSRRQYLKDPSSQWQATMHDFVAGSIMKLDYRQMNYGLLMALSSQIGRYFFRRLSSRYIYADVKQPYRFTYQDFMRDTAFFASDRTDRHIKAIDRALEELKSQRVIMTYSKNEVRGKRNKLMDVEYSLFASFPFVTAMKAANKCQSERAAAMCGARPQSEQARLLSFRSEFASAE